VNSGARELVILGPHAVGVVRRLNMSVYKVVEIIGTSSDSWEDAGLTAVKKARETIRQLRVAEVVEQDLDLNDDGTATFRTKLRVSFKYEDG
jgi:flavin-binding protein dodecin